MVLSDDRGSGGFGNGPKGPEVLAASEAVKPWLRIDPSERKRIKTEGVEDAMVMGVSAPSGGNL
jgi:hypothetical protein